MIVETLQGDLVEMLRNSKRDQEVFWMAQGCNCFITQGSGIAGQLREFPEVFQADVDYGMEGDRAKLGGFSLANVGADCHVLNVYSQYEYGTDKRHANYAAIGLAFMELNARASQIEMLYIPKIGSELAGGDWNIIEQVINDATPDLDITLIEFAKGVDPRIPPIDWTSVDLREYVELLWSGGNGQVYPHPDMPAGSVLSVEFDISRLPVDATIKCFADGFEFQPVDTSDNVITFGVPVGFAVHFQAIGCNPDMIGVQYSMA
ncbi:phosphatase [Vibrio phage D479]